MSAGNHPVVSVIVPARNEEACLGLCLESLVAQAGIEFEIIIVDDASTDRTAAIAQTFDVTVISAPPLPENWTGKNNAMSAGAKIGKGKWLLFTDADTVHKPGSLACAVAEAEQRDVALLSYSPEQEVRTFWEKAVMPVIFAELAATYPPKKVSDPAFPIAAANGQYLLISREAYDAVGGYAAIAGNLLEDVAMARLVKSSGRKIFFRYGGDAVRTRMYRSWSQMKEGWTKNLALLFPKTGELALERFWEFFVLLVVVSDVARVGYWKWLFARSTPSLFRWHAVILSVFTCVVFVWLATNYVKRMQGTHSDWRSTALGIIGLPIFAYLLLRSARSVKRARLDWKDRTYVYTPEEIEALRNRGASRAT